MDGSRSAPVVTPCTGRNAAQNSTAQHSKAQNRPEATGGLAAQVATALALALAVAKGPEAVAFAAA